jgi:hypothetical protein
VPLRGAGALLPGRCLHRIHDAYHCDANHRDPREQVDDLSPSRIAAVLDEAQRILVTSNGPMAFEKSVRSA